jgi:magnesium-transporting ATPase (P-type)
MKNKDRKSVDGFGKVASFVADLCSDNEKGSEPELDLRRQKYGVKKMEQKPPPSIFELVLNVIKDTTMTVLLVAAVISIIIGNAEASSGAPDVSKLTLYSTN